MIIRKPYAFLIKNFRKIHIVLLILSIYVAFKLIDVNSFVSEFMKLGTYDLYADPVTNHITWLLELSVFVLCVGSGALIALLRHKNKPWKAYLVPFIEYLVLFFVLRMIKNFFGTFTDDVETTDLRMSKDLLTMFLIGQLPSIGIFIMRVFGLDTKKFNFNSDAEYLELSEADREEVEIRFDFDKETIKRTFKRLIRNLNYIYKEHKTLCNTILTVLVIVLVYNIYNFIFVVNKTYKQGDTYNANGYTFKINNSYYTDKDGSGNTISKLNDFIILDVSITNNAEPRNLNLTNFHIRSGTKDYTTTEQTYSDEFSDLGKTIDSDAKIKRGEKINTIIIYKVEKKRWNTNYVLYYQENGQRNKLRKIKLNIKNISEIGKTKNLKLQDNMKIKTYNVNEEISFDTYKLEDTATYYVRKCSPTGCERQENTYTPTFGNHILEIEFSTLEFETKNTIDFLHKYGKIVYKDSDGVEQEIDIKNAINNTYYGKILYLLVPNDLTNDSTISFKIICRNMSYNYVLK